MSAVARRPSSRPWLSLSAVRLGGDGLVSALVGAYAAVLAVSIPGELGQDGWFSLVQGRAIANAGLPTRDTLTALTHGQPWVDQQWLAHLTLYLGWRAGGFPALGLLHVLSLTLAACLVSAGARRLGAPPLRTFVIALPSLATLALNSQIRAQSLAEPVFCAVLLLLCLDARRPSRRCLWVIPLLVLWANLHGSVLIGAALVVLRCAVAPRHPRGRLAILAGAAVLSPLASPYGPSLIRYYTLTAGNTKLWGQVSEWQPPALAPTTAAFFALLLATTWLLGRSGASLSTFGRAVLVVTGVAALQSTRNGIWFALACLLLLPGALEAAWPESRDGRSRRLFGAVGLAVLLLGIVGVAASLGSVDAGVQREWPRPLAARVAGSLRADPRLQVMATERYADWLLWSRPRLAGRVALDIRFELLGARRLRELSAFKAVAGPGWDRPFRRFRLVVYGSSDTPALDRALRAEPGVRTLYRGHGAVALLRPPGG